MKNTILTVLVAFFTFSACMAQRPSDEKDIKKVVTAFAQSADKQDVAAMGNLLDDNYRAVVNRLFGSNEVSLMDKTVYLQLLKDKKIGGDSRKVTIDHVDITNNNAMVKASFTGKELSFVTYLLLAKNTANEWRIVSDMPFIDKVKL